MLFSIIMANHNRASYIKDAVESINAQTFSDWELIINDDGSNDGSPEVIEKLAFGNPKIRTLFSREQRGVGLTHRESCLHARGDYIVVLDSDDAILPDTLSIFADVIKETKAGVLYSKIKVCDENLKPTGRQYGGDLYAKYKSYRDFAFCDPHGSLVSALRVFSKDIYDKTEGYGPYKNGIEKDILLKLEEKGARFHFIDEALYLYRRHPESIGATKKHDCMIDILDAAKSRQPASVSVKSKKPHLVQYNNVAWVGGTFYAAVDLASMLDEYHHTIMYRHNKCHDEAINYAKSKGIEVFQTTKLTEELVTSLDATAIIMNNPGRDSYELQNGEGLYEQTAWVKNYPILTWHHSAVNPWIPTRVHVFCSKYLEHQYRNLFDRIEHRFVIPPCINTESYSGVKTRELDQLKLENLVYGVVDSGKTHKDLLKELAFKVWPSKVVIADGSGPADTIHNNLTIMPKEKSLHNFFEEIDIYVHCPYKPGTWERVVTEAMASGLPIISNGGGGAEEQLKEAPLAAIAPISKDIDLVRENSYKLCQRAINEEYAKQRLHAYKIGGYQRLKDFRSILTLLVSGVY